MDVVAKLNRRIPDILWLILTMYELPRQTVLIGSEEVQKLSRSRYLYLPGCTYLLQFDIGDQSH